jgi:hypothetical protein
MRSSKITFVAAVLASIAWLSAPAFAGHNTSTHVHGHGGTKSHGHKHGAEDNTHSNKGGAQRGLDRANQVAGSHGEEGRENASAHHSRDDGPSHDADE